MKYFVFGLIRDNKTVFIGRGNAELDLQKIMHDHDANGIMFIARNLTELESLVLEYQLIYDARPDDNKEHRAYSGSSPWTYPKNLYKKFGIKLPHLV